VARFGSGHRLDNNRKKCGPPTRSNVLDEVVSFISGDQSSAPASTWERKWDGTRVVFPMHAFMHHFIMRPQYGAALAHIIMVEGGH
jgi:hypothetical protein